MATVSVVGTVHVDTFWPHLREGFQRSVMKTGGDLTTGDLWVQCRSGSAFLIIAHEGEEIRGASIWRPDTWQSGRVLRCLALYGHGMTGWIGDMHATAKRIAADCGATSLVAEGRPGWERIFKNARKLRILFREALDG